MKYTRVVLAAVLVAFLSLSVEASDVYSQKRTWSKTVIASQSIYGQWWKDQLDGIELGPWYTLSKNANRKTDSIYSSSGAPNLDETFADGSMLWKKRTDFVDGSVHFDLADASPEFRRLARTITSDRLRKLKLRLGVLTGIDITLNGRNVYSNANLGDGKYPQPDQATITLDLSKGTNHIEMQFPNKRFGGFYFSAIPKNADDPFDTVLDGLVRDFPIETSQLRRDARKENIMAWFRNPSHIDLPGMLAKRSAEKLGDNNADVRKALKKGADLLNVYAKSARLRKAWSDLESVDLPALRRAVKNLTEAYPGQYRKGGEYLRRVAGYETRTNRFRLALENGDESVSLGIAEMVEFEREVLLANPLLDFDRLVIIKRRPYGDPRVAFAHRGLGEFLGIPRQSSFQVHRIRQTDGWENEIAVADFRNNDRPLERLFAPESNKLVSDIDLHYNADSLLFCMPDDTGHWQVSEMGTDGSAPRQLSPSEPGLIHNLNACYLPNDEIAFISTAAYQGVPCNPTIESGMTFRMDGAGGNIRQLAFDQDHNYCPTVMNDGRILYLRWDYTDLPHVWSRVLFSMNPDGTGQRALYGSGAYWPNSIFFARAIPDHPSKLVGIVTGHHIGRDGELVIFDPAMGRSGPEGVVQQIPGHGKKVKAVIEDKLTEFSWPKFLQPYPLNENYFIVSCKPSPDDLWGIYLVDTFDNSVLLKEVEDYALFEPMPLRKSERPPVIVDRAEPDAGDGIVYIEDIYEGPGLAGVRRGTVDRLRLYTYHFAYPEIVGISDRIGTDGPWEPKRILGTVPVEKDGSIMFNVPANTPISMQPLDKDGRALQIMRSWMTARPGELVSCVGCHENQSLAGLNKGAKAARRAPSNIEPWHGPVRGFSFMREVQPVVDKYCVSCHDGREEALPNLRGDQDGFVAFKRNNPDVQLIRDVPRQELHKQYAGVFEPSYYALRRYIRVGGIESDSRLLNPAEFYANTSELVQMLEKGHYGVEMDAKSWERLTAWIDLNGPCHGTWSEAAGTKPIQERNPRRIAVRAQYAGIDEDAEAIPDFSREPVRPVEPHRVSKPKPVLTSYSDWPFDSGEARRRQKAKGGKVERKLDLGNGIKLDLVRVPAGGFAMGSTDGHYDEMPMSRVEINKPFWMGKFEITNEQYAMFNAEHDSRFEHAYSWIFEREHLGQDLNEPTQPVVRISWQNAIEFCEWISEKTNMKVSLPTESQWEWACRAGSESPMSYGGLDTDFGAQANLADMTIKELAQWGRHDSPDTLPRDERSNDGNYVTASVGTYAPNPWGLHDMHGNVWEWTRSLYRPYPYNGDDGRNTVGEGGRRVVRGGSWYDRPKRSTSAFRLSYFDWQKVYNTGFRVVIEIDDSPKVVAKVE